MADTPTITAHSVREIMGRERLEDYAIDAVVETAGGLRLQVAMVCDGAGGEAGETAARSAARTIIDYLQVSPATQIPKLLVRAVERANSTVFSELRGRGTTTVALACIDLNDNALNGRMFIASVGNSHLYFIRDGRLVRLNIDHTLANEYIYAGQMSPEEAGKLQNATYMTRALGVGAEVQVDIGFYAERGKTFVSGKRATGIGQKGMLLKPGDTIVAMTDGLRENAEDGLPFLRDDELLRHALDDDAERAATTLVRYAAARQPADNLGLSLVFVASPQRRAVRVSTLTRGQRAGIGVGLIGMLLLIGFVITQLFAARSRDAIIGATQTAIVETAIVLAYTATPSPTPTPTVTPTLAPTRSAPNQAGFQFFPDPNIVNAVFTNRVIFSPDINRVELDGPQRADGLAPDAPANLFLQSQQTLIELSVVDNTPGQEFIISQLFPEGDVFYNMGTFQNRGAFISFQQNASIRYTAQTACLSTKQIPSDPTDPEDTDKVALTCYTGSDGDCYLDAPGREQELFNVGERVVVDLVSGEVVSRGAPIFEELQTYYDTAVSLNSEPLVQCLSEGLDTDGDGVPYPVDLCPDEPGSLAADGCPDRDGDGVVDSLDLCPDAGGFVDADGCPLATFTPDLTNSATPTPSLTPSATVRATRTPTETATVSPTPSATRTLLVATRTPLTPQPSPDTPTNTPVTPTATFTSTNTSLAPTFTLTATLTASATDVIITVTPSPTSSFTPTRTLTATPVTPTVTPSSTFTPTFTLTPTFTFTPTPTFTFTPTPTPTFTITPTFTPEFILTLVETSTPEP